MKEEEFTRFLVEQKGIISKEKAVISRVSKGKKVEIDLGVNLDEIVKNDQRMYELLLRIKDEMNEHNGNYQNSVRKYYLFKNSKEFPTLNQYRKTSG